MSLPALRLDDLTWDELRRLAQRRIPAASAGVWTHHAPVDPGITLLELFAFLLDQQVFALDQVPDSLVRAVFTLLGESTRPTGVARTVLTATASAAATLTSGSVVRPDHDGLGDLLYTLLSSSAVLPVRSLAVEVAGRQTLQGKPSPVTVLAADGRPASFDIVVQLTAPAPATAAEFTLLVELDVAERVAPSWAVGAVQTPPPALLSFAVVSGGATRALAGSAVDDQTLGFRRSGLLRFAFAPEWSGATELRLRISTLAATFAAPPRILRITANALVAEHAVERTLNGRAPDGGPWDGARRAIAEQLDRWLPLSNLHLDLPMTLGTPIEETVRLSLTRNGVPLDWEGVADLSCAAPSDRKFTLDRERNRLSFGDGYRGRVPAPALDFALHFRAGGGASGNLPAGLPWILSESGGPDLTSLVNVVAAQGGREAESIADARQRVSGSLARSERVVTALDIVELVENVAGLGPHRAQVTVGFHPAFPCAYVPDSVGVFVVPRVPRRSEEERAQTPAPEADPGALALIAEHLERARMLATRLHVLKPRYRPVSLAITVRTNGAPAELGQAIEHALARHLDAVVGGDGEGWEFGHPLRPSELVGVAQRVAGDEALVERVAIGIDAAVTMDDCSDTPIGRHDLVYLARATVRFTPLSSGGRP